MHVFDNNIVGNPEQRSASLLIQEISGDGVSVIDSTRYAQETIASVLSVKKFSKVMPYSLQCSFFECEGDERYIRAIF
jgi:hypothetical protein